jgi:dipeptidyl aminopeptidase/acylaminoacyl peptidase
MAALLFSVCAAWAVPPYEAYGRLPSLSMVTLSPDGTKVAYVKAGDIKRWVVVQKLGQPAPIATMDVGDAKLRAIYWADDEHVILTISSFTRPPQGFTGHRSDWYVPTVLDLAKGTQYTLFDKGIKTFRYNMMNIGSGFGAIRKINGHNYVYSSALYFPDPARVNLELGLFRVDLTDGDIKLVSRPTDTGDDSWLVDENGKILAIEQYFESTTTWRLAIPRPEGRDLTIDFKSPIESPSVEGLTEDGTGLIMRLPDDLSEKPMYDRVSLTDGTRTPWRRDQFIDGVYTDRYTAHAVGGDQSVEATEIAWFEPVREKIWKAVKATFKSATDVRIVSWSDDRSKVILNVFGPSLGAGYFFLDMTTHQASPIGLEYDQINQVFEQKWIEYKAKDGRVIHAYLTMPQLPPGKDAKNLPLVVFPHGGPQARDYPGFDFFSQGLASLGYVVLQPEFRGSAGFGKDLLWAGFDEIGKKMQTDLSDGVRALAAQGLIDPKRVCIAGWSYGGYAALAGATLDTGVYRCAIAGAGVSDMRKQVRHWQSGKWEDPGVRFWKRFLGVEDLSDSKIDAINPVNFADRITIPVLLIHGIEDTTVPYEQSVFMASAMDSAHKPYEFVRLEGEDHHLSRSKTRLAAMKAMRDFLLKNNPPD